MRGRAIEPLVFALVLLAGCNMNSDEPSTTLDQGLARARAYVEETVAAAADGFRVKPEETGDPIECTDELGRGDETFHDNHAVTIDLHDHDDATRLFDQTIAYWEENGYEISLENAARGEPVGDDAVVAVELGGGYFGALELFPSRGNAHLGITTPCLPPSADD